MRCAMVLMDKEQKYFRCKEQSMLLWPIAKCRSTSWRREATAAAAKRRGEGRERAEVRKLVHSTEYVSGKRKEREGRGRNRNKGGDWNCSNIGIRSDVCT